jgi:hypothetical protein
MDHNVCLKMNGKRTVTFANDEALFLLESQNAKRDEKFGLPVKFLSALYHHGYKVAEIVDKTDDLNPFFDTVSRQMAVYGVHYSPSELRENVIKFEKENMTSLSEMSALITPQLCKLGDIAEESVEDHIIEFENNRGMIEIFDMYCTARFLDVEVRVFTPDFENELILNRFNEKGPKKEFVVAVVMDSSRRPVRLFRTYTVHKHDVLDDPYHIVLKRRKTMK